MTGLSRPALDWPDCATGNERGFRERLLNVNFDTADVGGPVDDAADDGAHVPVHAGDHWIAVGEGDVVVSADEGDIIGDFEAAQEQELHGGHKVGHLVHDERGGRRGMEERAQAGVEAALTPFIDNTAQAFADADLVVCRAGASTVTEIATPAAVTNGMPAMTNPKIAMTTVPPANNTA